MDNSDISPPVLIWFCVAFLSTVTPWLDELWTGCLDTNETHHLNAWWMFPYRNVGRGTLRLQHIWEKKNTNLLFIWFPSFLTSISCARWLTAKVDYLVGWRLLQFRVGVTERHWSALQASVLFVLLWQDGNCGWVSDWIEKLIFWLALICDCETGIDPIDYKTFGFGIDYKGGKTRTRRPCVQKAISQRSACS